MPIVERYAPLLASATRGVLDAWAADARGRLALIIVLDQFSRSIHKGSARRSKTRAVWERKLRSRTRRRGSESFTSMRRTRSAAIGT